MIGLPSSLGQSESDEDVALNAEHLLLLLGLRVIEAEQVKDAMGRQQQHLLEGRMTRRLGLGDGDLRADDDVAEQPGGREVVLAARAQGIATTLGLAASLLVTRRELEALVCGEVPRRLRDGWRGEALAALLAEPPTSDVPLWE